MLGIKRGFLDSLYRLRFVIIVILFICAFLIQDYLYIYNDQAPQYTDCQFLNSITYYDSLVMHDKLVNLETLPYPPVAYMATLPGYVLKDISPQTARISIMLFSIIFLISMFGIGRELGDEYSGLAVMALAASSPHILNYSRAYFVNFPQTAMTAASFCFLLKSKKFTDSLYSILFGISLALSFLTKWSTAFFMIIPVLWIALPSFYRSIKQKKSSVLYITFFILFLILQAWFWVKQSTASPPLNGIKYYLLLTALPCIFALIFIYSREKHIKATVDIDEHKNGFHSMTNFLISMVFFFVIAMPWYYYASKAIINLFVYNKSVIGPSSGDVKSNLVILSTMYNFLPLYLLPGLLFVFRKKENRDIISLLFTNILFLSLIVQKVSFPEPRYILSIVIFLAAAGGYWVCNLHKFKKIVTALIITTSLLSIFAWTGISVNYKFFHPVPVHRPDMNLRKKNCCFKLYCTHPPDSSAYSISQAVEEITPTDKSTKKPVPVLFVNKKEIGKPFEIDFIEWEARKRGRRIEPIPLYISKSKDIQRVFIELEKKDKEKFQKIKEILIIHREDPINPDCLKELSGTFENLPVNHYTYKAGENWSITVIQLYNEDLSDHEKEDCSNGKT